MAFGFFGTYNHQLDDKSRLRLPAKLRNELGGNFFCLKGFANTIMVFTKEKFASFCEQYSKISFTDVKAQRALTEIASSAFEIEEDAQGRFVLPLPLKKYANIEKNVVIKGAVGWIEIWSEEAHLNRECDINLDELVVNLKSEE